MNARISLAVGLMLCLGSIRALQAQDIPESASKIIKSYDKEVEDLKYKLEQDLKLAKEKMLVNLEKLAKDLEKNGKAGDARTVRNHIETLKKGPIANVLPNPGYLTAYRNRVGQSFHFRVTGTNTGTVWGTDIYTDDSVLSTACVHAGLLTVGQTGVVKVTILPGQQSYTGTTRNGVTTKDYAAWEGSFKIERP